MSGPPVYMPVWNYGLQRLPMLGKFLEQPVRTALLPARCNLNTGWVGWGEKASAKCAAWYAKRTGGRLIRLEDGFLRSFGTGDRFPALSLVVDDEGIYFNSTRPSALENLLNSSEDLLAGVGAEATLARSLMLTHRLSKYNHAPLLDTDALRPGDVQRVLVIDQTDGDLSVRLGGSGKDTFAVMFAAARRENPQATIYIKTHPEVSSGRKRGYLTHIRDGQRIKVLRMDVNPLSLIEQMDKVYVVTSLMGFEALLAGKPVTVFGMPWYAGWGVTDDRRVCPRRVRQHSVDVLFAAAYLRYARYLNPVTYQRGTIFDVIDWLVRQRRMAFPELDLENCTLRPPVFMHGNVAKRMGGLEEHANG